jgi:beta-lactamase class A
MKTTSKLPLFKIGCIVVLALLIAIVGYAKFHHSSAKDATQTTTTHTDATTKQSTGTTQKPVAHTDAQLQQIIDTWAAQHSFDATVAVQELNSNLRTASHNPDSLMTTASTYKIYVAYAALHQVEQGKFSMSTPTRTGQTVSQALNKMILQSDNTSAEALGFLVGWDTVNSLAASVGATHTDINNYDSAGNPVNGNKQSTANDLTLMVTKLQSGTLLNASNSALLLGLMKSQVWRERIPAGVPSGIAVADKPGWLDNVENDAAIVYGPKSTYTLVIMTNGSSTQPLADLSKQIYDYLQS